MKTNNMFKAALCAVLGLSLVSCAEDAYVPAPQEDASKTYVRVDASVARNLDIDGSDIQVPFVRNNKSGAMDITVALADTSGLFTLKSTTVSFAADKDTAYAAVSYSYDDLDPAAEYAITVSMTNEDVASQYTAVSLPMTCKKAWQNLGIAQWYDSWWIGGPFEKVLLKAPDGTETYRLVNPWDEASVIEGGLEFVKELPYFEFVINEDGSIVYDDIDLGFTLSGRTCHNWYPAGVVDSAVPQNKMIMENVAQIMWVPLMNNGSSWWGKAVPAYISFPGGPDLSELLELE